MTVYGWLKTINQDDTFAMLVKAGVFSFTVVWYLKYYEDYLEHLTGQTNKTTAVTWTADQNGKSDRTIWSAIQMMEAKITTPKEVMTI